MSAADLFDNNFSNENLSDEAPPIVVADAMPAIPRLLTPADRALPIFILASLIVHATAILPSLLRDAPEKAAAPKEIAVEVVQEAPKPPEKPKPPAKAQQQAAKAPRQEAPKQEAAKRDAPKQEAPKQLADKQQQAQKEAARKDAAKPHTGKQAAKPQPAKPEIARKEAAKQPKTEAKPQPQQQTVADRFRQLIGPMPAVALPGSSADGTEEVSYTQLVLSKLAKAKKEGRYQGIPGAAGVSFTVGDAGEVVSVEIIRPSGDKSLDDEAIAMVKRGAPYPPPPPGGRRDYTITLRFQALI